MKIAIPDETEMITLGCRLANALPEGGLVVALSGELGTGKTTLVRALLRTLGVEGHIRSPTYTLVEPYGIGGRRIYHLDLYRIGDPEELEFLGVRDLDPANDLIFIEWPERGGQSLPAADLTIAIHFAAQDARELGLHPCSRRGEAVAASLQGNDVSA